MAEQKKTPKPKATDRYDWEETPNGSWIKVAKVPAEKPTKGSDK